MTPIKKFYALSLATCLCATLAASAAAENPITVDFKMAGPAQMCSEINGDVVGLQSPLPSSAKKTLFNRYFHHPRIESRKTRLRNAWNERFGTQQPHTVTLKYALEPTPETEGKKIQNITLTMPGRFHRESEYELACRSTASGSEFITYWKYSPRLRAQGIYEPEVVPLPADCAVPEGEVRIQTMDYRSADKVAEELKSSIFRATLWNPDSSMTAPSPLEIYLPKISYHPGERLSFRTHTTDTSKPAVIELIRVGKDATTWKTITDLKLTSQKITSYSSRDGVNWPESASLNLPSDIANGYYVALLRQGEAWAAFPFVIRPAAGNKADIAIIAATNTWHAYNGWGGGSFYKSDIGKKCLGIVADTLISTQRPIAQPDPLGDPTHEDHLFRAEKQLAQWFEENNYSYAVYTEDDLDTDPSFLKDHTAVVLPSHPEYYTKEMYDNLEGYSADGGNILYLGGNVLYYRTTRQGNLVEKHTTGRRHDLDGEMGGYWSAHLDRSPARLLGVDTNARDYDTWAPYVVKQADHAAFADTGLKNGDSFTEKGSGHEMDVMTAESPAGTVLLAKGSNPAGFGGDMVLLTHPSGGMVFSVGSIPYAYGLVNDEKAGIVLKNVIKMMLAPEKPQTP